MDLDVVLFRGERKKISQKKEGDSGQIGEEEIAGKDCRRGRELAGTLGIRCSDTIKKSMVIRFLYFH